MADATLPWNLLVRPCQKFDFVFLRTICKKKIDLCCISFMQSLGFKMYETFLWTSHPCLMSLKLEVFSLCELSSLNFSDRQPATLSHQRGSERHELTLRSGADIHKMELLSTTPSWKVFFSPTGCIN